MKRVVVATHNEHKVAEIRAILDLPDWEFVSLSELGITEEPVEDADGFVGNAHIKAQFAHERTGLAALADDSGLVVDALGGAPGVYSSRYAGEDASDSSNNAKLLQALEGVSVKDRAARFVCALVFIDADGSETVSEGFVTGRIATDGPRGNNGFGYDPLFEVESCGYTRTMAELEPAEKNTLSHRYQALEVMKEHLMTPSSQSDSPFSQSDSPLVIQSEANRGPRNADALWGGKYLSSDNQEEPLTQIVAFDFDGTLIDGSSPVRLIRRLDKEKLMAKGAIAKSMLWGLRYKMGTELDQAQPRRYVFSSFKNSSVEDANAIMRSLYFDELRGLLRPQALEALEMHKAAGRKVIIVSASFEPIITACCEDLGISDYISTRMEVKDGMYTGETLGLPPEGEQKLIQFVAWADEKYGSENWCLTHAYGDHFSDVPLMEIAMHPIAIDPDRRLESIAAERGWQVDEWI